MTMFLMYFLCFQSNFYDSNLFLCFQSTLFPMYVLPVLCYMFPIYIRFQTKIMFPIYRLCFQSYSYVSPHVSAAMFRPHIGRFRLFRLSHKSCPGKNQTSAAFDPCIMSNDRSEFEHRPLSTSSYES